MPALRQRMIFSTHDALAARVGKPGVLDLIATVGFYVTLGAIANSFDPPLDEGVPPL